MYLFAEKIQSVNIHIPFMFQLLRCLSRQYAVLKFSQSLKKIVIYEGANWGQMFESKRLYYH